MAAGLVILIDERNAQLLALIETRHELDLLSRINAVTKIANRRIFDEQLRLRLRTRLPFALMMVDVDRFELFNDTFGHSTGDLMLARIATILGSELRRSEDLVARYRGEEFALLIDDIDKLSRLYAMVESGVTDLDDILKDRIAALKSARERAAMALERLRDTTAARLTIDPEKIERFSSSMRKNLTSGPIPFRKAYLRAVVERIIGDKADLEQVIAAGSLDEGVRRSVPKWRALRDSNPRPSGSKPDTLSC